MDLLSALGASLFIQLVLFIPAFLLKTDSLTDLSYSLTFILLAFVAFIRSPFSDCKLILFAMITMWGLRLASYLVLRIFKIGKDFRFDGIRDSASKFIRFWLFQGIAAWVILIPTILFMESEPVVSPLLWAGLVLWFMGFPVESIADQQKHQFKSKNKDKWVNVGLWKYSRHPNYFGEMLCWAGIYLYTASSLAGFDKLALVSPVFLALILIYVSGVPPLEAYADERWGKIKDYQEYRRKTPAIIPWFPKKN